MKNQNLEIRQQSDNELLKSLAEAYQEVAKRLGLTPQSGTGEVTKLEIIKS